MESRGPGRVERNIDMEKKQKCREPEYRVGQQASVPGIA